MEKQHRYVTLGSVVQRTFLIGFKLKEAFYLDSEQNLAVCWPKGRRKINWLIMD